MVKRFLKYIAPKAFLDGQIRCNELGKNLVIRKPAQRMLDLGCGDGALTIEFAKILLPKEIHGVEFVDSEIKKAEKNGIRCRKLDLNEKWNYDDGYFDFILSSQNIEHLHNTRLYLEECLRCLKPSGQLIILTENLASWVNILALVFGWQPFSTTCMNGWSLGNPLIWHANEPKDKVTIENIYRLGISGTVGHVRVLAFMCLKFCFLG